MRRINKQHSTNSMETSDLLKRVRQIEIKTRGLSNNIFAGQYHSAFKGKGMSFSEVREYQYGDDVRDIDWNVTARYNKPFVKVYFNRSSTGVPSLQASWEWAAACRSPPEVFAASASAFKRSAVS